MGIVIKYLSSKTSGWISLLLAIFCRVINVLFVTELSRDKIFLALQSKNLLYGHGLSVTKYIGADSLDPIYDLTPRWPPGYPVLLAPFLKIFNYDVYSATTAIDLISSIAIIFILRKIAMVLQLPMAAVNIVTLIAGCFEYAFISQSMPTDTSAFAIFMLGILLLLKAVSKGNINYNQVLIISLLLFIPCTFRYSYPPLSLAAFFSVAFVGWYVKNKLLFRKGLIGFTSLSLFLAAFFISLKLATGNAAYIVETERGFFPANFLEWAPITPGAFINTFFTTSQLIRLTGISVQQAINFLDCINAIMLISFTIIFFYLFFKKRFFKTMDPFKWFLLTGFFISAATCASLAYLSLTYKPQEGWGNYLGEPRYFMFVTLYLQLSFFGWIFLYPQWKKKLFQKLIAYTLSFLVFVEITHSIYFNSKVIFNFNKYRTETYKEPDYVYFTDMIKPVIRNNPDTDIYVLSHSDEFYPLMGSYLGLKGIDNGEEFIKTFSLAKKKSILILALYDPELPVYQNFLNENKAQLIDRINNVNLYRVDFIPNNE